MSYNGALRLPQICSDGDEQILGGGSFVEDVLSGAGKGTQYQPFGTQQFRHSRAGVGAGEKVGRSFELKSNCHGRLQVAPIPQICDLQGCPEVGRT